MKDPVMKDTEARLERSLRAQVKAPKLDGRFDAAVWARIEAAKQPTTIALPTRTSAAARWLKVGNGIALVVAVLLVIVYAVRQASAIEIGVELPQLPAQVSLIDINSAKVIFGYAITVAALLFGCMFTPLGDKLRREFI